MSFFEIAQQACHTHVHALCALVFWCGMPPLLNRYRANGCIYLVATCVFISSDLHSGPFLIEEACKVDAIFSKLSHVLKL